MNAVMLHCEFGTLRTRGELATTGRLPYSLCLPAFYGIRVWGENEIKPSPVRRKTSGLTTRKGLVVGFGVMLLNLANRMFFGTRLVHG